MKKFFALLIASAMLFALSACGTAEDTEGDEPENSESEAVLEEDAFTELTVDSIEEQGDAVIVTTSYGTVKYPYAFSDVIAVSTENEENSARLIFSVLIGTEEFPSYTLIFNGTEGILIGSVAIGGENSAVPVYVEFHEAGNLGEEMAGTFNAVQETFNDVLTSLCENGNFVPEV